MAKGRGILVLVVYCFMKPAHTFIRRVCGHLSTLSPIHFSNQALCRALTLARNYHFF